MRHIKINYKYMQKIKINKKVASSDAKNLSEALVQRILISALPVEGKVINFSGGKQIEVENKRFVIQDKTNELSIFQEKYPHGFSLCGNPEEKTVVLKEVFYFLPYEVAQQIWGREILQQSL